MAASEWINLTDPKEGTMRFLRSAIVGYGPGHYRAGEWPDKIEHPCRLVVVGSSRFAVTETMDELRQLIEGDH